MAVIIDLRMAVLKCNLMELGVRGVVLRGTSIMLMSLAVTWGLMELLPCDPSLSGFMMESSGEMIYGVLGTKPP